MDTERRALFELHIAVLLFGISGLFGKLLPIEPSLIVFGRTIIGFMALLAILAFKRQLSDFFVSGEWWINCCLGVILGLHWITFFKAIQVSSVAVGLLAFASTPIFVTLMEPVLYREKIRTLDLISMLTVVFGLYLVIPPLGEDSHIVNGMCWGIFSAFLFAVLSLANRHRLRKTKPLVLTLQQNLGAAVTAALIMPYSNFSGLADQIPLIMVLGLICTTLPLILMLNSLRYLKAQLVTLTCCLEPVYGILLAALLLSEIPSMTTLIGGSVILGTISLASVLKDKFSIF